ncbi:MAG: hypothetical protein ACLSUM_07780 [Dysosmobacter welbionis]
MYRPEDRLYHGGRPDAGELCGRNGQRLVAVTLQDGNDWADHAALYDYGFPPIPPSWGPLWARQSSGSRWKTA